MTSDIEAEITEIIHAVLCDHRGCLGDRRHELIARAVRKLSLFMLVTNLGEIMQEFSDAIVNDAVDEDLKCGIQYALVVVSLRYQESMNQLMGDVGINLN